MYKTCCISVTGLRLWVVVYANVSQSMTNLMYHPPPSGGIICKMRGLNKTTPSQTTEIRQILSTVAVDQFFEFITHCPFCNTFNINQLKTNQFYTNLLLLFHFQSLYSVRFNNLLSCLTHSGYVTVISDVSPIIPFYIRD